MALGQHLASDVDEAIESMTGHVVSRARCCALGPTTGRPRPVYVVGWVRLPYMLEIINHFKNLPVGHFKIQFY